MTYAEIASALRHCSKIGDCDVTCPRAGTGEGCITGLKIEAANAIEQLSAELAVAENLLKKWGSDHNA